MNLLRKLFGKKEHAITSNEDFWRWFKANEKTFFAIVKQRDNIESDFFSKLSPKLNELKDGYYFLTGMLNDDTADLVLTADGDIRNIAFVEALVKSAPKMSNWVITALKPPLDIENVSIKMGEYVYGADNLFFYPDENADYPDEINLNIVYADFNENDKGNITNGIYIFLDNFLGELNLATTIDNITIIGKISAKKDLIPIEKLKPYLIWREKEFVEKYEGTRHNTDNDTYLSLEAVLDNGKPLMAIVNAELLKWDGKASHPWLLNVEIKYDGSNNNGMPDSENYELLNTIEDEVLAQLKDIEGYLNVGRQTADGVRNIYIACKDFRQPSMVLGAVKQHYPQLELNYEMYKDKYWQSLDKFTVTF